MDKSKYLYIVIAIISLVVVLDIGLFYFAFIHKDTVVEKKYENDNISFTYTTDYVLKVENNKISLGRDDKSGQIDIVVNELSNEANNRDESIIIEEAKKDFEKKNNNYFVGYFGDYKVGKYTVHDYLYSDESSGKQIDLNYIYKDNKVIVISYTNDDKYFDLYEGSVLDIINSLEIL